MQSVAAPSPRSVSYTSDLDQTLANALEHARAISVQKGFDCPDAAIAWEVVEELMVVKYRQRVKPDMALF